MIGDYIYLDNPETDQAFLDELCEWFLERYEADNRFFISYDLETQGLNPKYKKILLHSLCWRKDQAIVIRDRGFDFTKLKEVLAVVPIVGQNIKFDAKFVQHHLDVTLKIFMDTMVAAMMGYSDSFPGKRFSLDNIVANIFPFVKMEKQIRNSFIDREL
jgi:DNA polymerase I-like protein with 3'-5' exonuclease and polymerase domains